MSRQTELEAALIANPSSLDTRLVYADLLQAQGDPRGELISMQHAGRVDQANVFLEKHAAAFYGPLEQYTTSIDGEDTKTFDWHLGFIRKARFSLDSNYLRGADDRSLEAALATLLAHPSGLLLEELVLAMNMLDDGGYFEPLIAILAKHGAQALKRLRIGEYTNAGGPGGEGDYVYENSWTRLGNASALWKAIPGLETLVIQVGLGSSNPGQSDVLGTIELPHLRHLEVITGGLSQENARSIAVAKWPQLSFMNLWFGNENYGGNAVLEDLGPIFDGSGLSRLEHLGLMNATFTDELCARLVAARVAPQLKELSLAHGVLTDDGAAILGRNAKAFMGLTSLDVSNCYLTPQAISALSAVFPEVVVGEQRPADPADDRYVALSE